MVATGMRWNSIVQIKIPSGQVIASSEGFLAVIGWVTWLVVLHVLLPGRHVQGNKLKDGSQLTYKLNGDWQYMTWF